MKYNQTLNPGNEAQCLRLSTQITVTTVSSPITVFFTGIIISGSHVHKLNTLLSHHAFSNKFKFHLQNKLSDSLNFSRIQILSEKKNIKTNSYSSYESLNDVNKFFIYSMSLNNVYGIMIPRYLRML